MKALRGVIDGDEIREEEFDLEPGDDLYWLEADPELTENVFCPTGPGGGVDPTCSPKGHEMAEHIKKNSPKKLTALYLDKLKVLNPNGIENNTLKVPHYWTKSKSAVATIAALQTVFPGVQIKMGVMTAKTVDKKLGTAHAKISGVDEEEDDFHKSVPNLIFKGGGDAEKVIGQNIHLPKSASDVTVLKSLPGSTHPQLVQDKEESKIGGKHAWVMKTGPGKDQLQNEADADAVYRAMGVPTPYSTYNPESGTKFSYFIKDGQTLSQWESGKSKAEIDAMHQEIGKHMALDALLGNWDVIGQTKDNILIGPNGVPYRIDNGGAMKYRAQGTPKGDKFGPTVGELATFRDPSKSASKVFGKVTDSELRAQMKELVQPENMKKIVSAIHDPNTQAAVAARLVYFQGKIAQGFGTKYDPDKAGVAVKTTPTKPSIEDSLVEKIVKVPKAPGLTKEQEAWTKHIKAGGLLTSAERLAIDDWQSSSYAIRHSISKGKPSEVAQNILSAFEKAPKYEGQTYRSLKSSSTTAKSIIKIASGEAKNGGVGSIIEIKAPGSTSRHITSDFGNHTLLIMRQKSGVPIEGYGISGEEEVIHREGKNWKILDYTTDKTYTTGGASKHFNHIVTLEEQ